MPMYILMFAILLFLSGCTFLRSDVSCNKTYVISDPGIASIKSTSEPHPPHVDNTDCERDWKSDYKRIEKKINKIAIILQEN